jgi:hypothetical protein
MTTTAPTLIPWEGFNPDYPGHVAPACRQITQLLSDGCWHPWADIVVTVAEAHGLAPKTVSGLLRGMVRLGTVERRGTYRRKPKRCTRELRLAAQR